MTLAGIELRYLINNISKKIEDYYVSNIYGINRDSLLFKLHHPESHDQLLMISPMGLWLTGVKIEQIEQNKLLKRLRNDLLRLKLEKIEQIEDERIAFLKFSGFDKEFLLVIEFFGEGNILLCDKDMKILALLHSIDVRHRQLKIGTNYVPPPRGKNVFDITLDELKDVLSSPLAGAKLLGRNLGLPKKYVEKIFSNANIDPKKPGNSLGEQEIKIIFDSVTQIVNKVVKGDHDPVIVKVESNKDVYPVKLTENTQDTQTVSSFMEGLDIVFTESILKGGKSLHSEVNEKRVSELENQLAEQNKAIEQVKEKSDLISNLAKSLLNLVSKGILSISDPEAKNILKQNDSEIISEKGISFVKIQNEKIKVNLESSLPTIASLLFDESKKQAGAIESIQKQIKKTSKSLEEQKQKSNASKLEISFSEVRKKNWFERYRWFYTSDNILAIGGRDSSSNSAIIRKHLEKNDIVFHADIHGSPFFILKNDEEKIPPLSLNETAHATVCFSRAWREAVYGMNAFWVTPQQVKKAAPSGQFLPKGSFIIEGQRNFVNISSLKLAVGIMKNDQILITCGPPAPIKDNCVCYAILEPGGSEMVDVAKKIKSEFVKLNENMAKTISLDEIIRVLPAGKSHIIEVDFGEKKG